MNVNLYQILLIALILDGILGEPNWLWAKLSHPISLMGRAIAWLDDHWNFGDNRRHKGVYTVALLSSGALASGWAISILPDFDVLETISVAILLAHRSLVEHVGNVAPALRDGIEQGRRSVAMIVGRDPDHMEESDIARAAIESGAENFSDGVIAPAFWFLVLGLPGMVLYKVVNTADNMIGYQTERHKEFGWAAAKLDDVMNWIPARITGGLICFAHWSKHGWNVMLADANGQRSPNAGWPEGALAGVLNLALSGPRSYHGSITEINWLNKAGRATLGPNDIEDSVRVLWRSWAAFVLIVAIVTIIV